MTEKPPGGTSIITHPAIVKSALAQTKKKSRDDNGVVRDKTRSKGKNGPATASNRENDPPREKTQSSEQPRPSKPREVKEVNEFKEVNESKPKVDATATDGPDAKPKKGKGKNGKSKTNTRTQTPSSPSPGPGSATPKKSDGPAGDDDLRSILFPELFGNGAKHPGQSSGVPSGPKGSQKTRRSKSNDTPQKSRGMPEGHEAFAGSSFHSSPAASALPRPSFMPKADVATSAPPVSMLEKFMLADKQERQAAKQVPASEPKAKPAPAPTTVDTPRRLSATLPPTSFPYSAGSPTHAHILSGPLHEAKPVSSPLPASTMPSAVSPGSPLAHQMMVAQQQHLPGMSVPLFPHPHQQFAPYGYPGQPGPMPMMGHPPPFFGMPVPGPHPGVNPGVPYGAHPGPMPGPMPGYPMYPGYPPQFPAQK